MVRKVTNETEKDICELYIQGFGTVRIANKLNLGKTTVRKYLIKNNIKFRTVPRIPKEIEQNIIELYQKGLSIKQLAGKFNFSFSRVQRHLKKRLELRERGSKKAILKTAKELTQEKAYVMGVVGPGDGFIELTKQAKRICLEAVDKDFIDYFAYCLQKVYGLAPAIKVLKPRPTDTKPHYKVCLYSVEACKDLLSYNVSFKEKSWEVPKEIINSPEEIISSYIRGMADSQGSVHKSTSRRVQLSSKNTKGVRQIGLLLEKLGIVDWYIHNVGLSITARRSLETFDKKINFNIKMKNSKLN